ncbi:MAG TPA: chloride channel protein [Edaphocola sp.]|nr:chloride channel protein [Edaphocola sp.]
MSKYKSVSNIPVAISLETTLERENIKPKFDKNKKRLVYISILAIIIAILISLIAKVLMLLINFITHVSFYGDFSFSHVGLIENHMGLWIIFIPAIGGILVGLTAFYGSRGIQGHGIPEAMEQVLTNKSRIKPILTFLKPLSSAIAIGTGGPFGAEGPIIATGGALGSNFGEFLRITHNERKILLSAGAAAGTTAIFGTPIAGLFLAVELLLFEFSPRSIIPCALACITATAGYHIFFRSGPVFAMGHAIDIPSNIAIAFYSGIGLLVGFVSILVTKGVYWIEDLFNKIPIHWAWYPALGGLFAGLIGYFLPSTLGVGYENITNILSGTMAVDAVMILCVLKLISWLVSLASGTSGGTLAPLMTVGGALGAGLGYLCLYIYPHCGVTVPLAALIGMMALFTGASRALLTSIIFGVESTGQFNALLPLLAGCSGSYFVSFFLMQNTIMTEKIARRGVKAPDSYEPDILEEITVGRIMHDNAMVVSDQTMIKDIKDTLEKEPELYQNFFIVTNKEDAFKGILSTTSLYQHQEDDSITLAQARLIIHHDVYIHEKDDLKEALELMNKEKLDVLPVLSDVTHEIKGIICYKDILDALKNNYENDNIPFPFSANGQSKINVPLPGKRIYQRIDHWFNNVRKR